MRTKRVQEPAAEARDPLVATVRDEGDPGEGTPVALFQPNRGALGRDG
jgi:hypothetical protein